MACVIWINGPFGGGKTAVASALNGLIPNAIVFDPELVGHVLWKTVPYELQRDEFECEPLWRLLVKTTVSQLATTYARPLIVPMTLVRPEGTRDIFAALRQENVQLSVFSLLAHPDVVEERLLRRGERPNSWEGQQIARCLRALHHDTDSEKVFTDELDAQAAARHILTILQTSGLL